MPAAGSRGPPRGNWVTQTDMTQKDKRIINAEHHKNEIKVWKKTIHSVSVPALDCLGTLGVIFTPEHTKREGGGNGKRIRVFGV